jgi:hypothetical protein
VRAPPLESDEAPGAFGVVIYEASAATFTSIHELPRETVWKIDTVPILESHEWADRDQQALFGHLMLPETAFNKHSSYFPDSL